MDLNLNNTLPLLIVLSAFIPGLLIFAIPDQREKLRTFLNLGGNLLCLSLIGVLLSGVYAGRVFETRLPLLPNMDLVLNADALSLLFVSLSGLLWLLTTIYAVGYFKGSTNLSRFFGFFSLCVSATAGIALAGNLITFLIFYELLTLTTYPLVVHKGNPASLRAGRVYLVYTMIGGALLLAGVAWLKSLAGALDFTATGILSSLPHLDPLHLQIIFVLLIVGLGVKAALVPLHGWLPIAMAAPAPVSALLHAVAVVKAGAFGIVRVVYDVYGIEFARDLGLTAGLAVLASITIVYGSIRALYQNDFKKRLAYSTVSQVSYIALGTAIAGPIATIGGIVHLVHQGLMKITMFFCAGSLAETLKIHKISEMNGVGRRMPLTMTAFTIAALGMIGLPPVAGFVSKWYIGTGALEVGAYWVLGVLAASSLLNAAYFLPVIYAAWFKPAQQEWPDKPADSRFEAHWMLLLPPVVTASLAMVVGLFANAGFTPLSWVKLISSREYGLTLVPFIPETLLSFPQLWLIILVPLLLASLFWIKPIRPSLGRFACWAAVPALLVGIWLPDTSVTLNWLFFSSVIALDGTTRVILLMSSILWFVAGVYGTDYLKRDKQFGRYGFFFLLCMTGNFGLILNQDVFGYITFFSLMSFAAYGLVIHTASAAALQAGKTYIQWVVIGEVVLFAALAGLAFTGTNPVSGLDNSLQPLWVSWLFVIGFGIKTGLLGLHFWLPRAHPVAPVPASALLSGLMVKAGLIGWWRFMPAGEVELPGIGATMIVLGLGAAFLAVLAGLVQRNPKTLLAYSTISQLGILTTGVGVAFRNPEAWPLLLPALTLYAVHHGIAKGALFLSVGLGNRLAKPGIAGALLWLAVIMPALALTGIPITSGALAKSALKSAVADIDWLILVLPLSAVATSCLMMRFLGLLKEHSAKSEQSAVGIPGILAFGSLSVFVVLLLPLLPQSVGFSEKLYSLPVLWTAIWPVTLGAALYWILRKPLARTTPVPAGDLIVIIETCNRFLFKQWRSFSHCLESRYNAWSDLTARSPIVRVERFASDAEINLRPQPGVVLIAIMLAVALTMVLY